MHDVLVAGNGPAGLALTRSLARLGADVVCVAPSFADPWRNNYGVWVDELEPIGWSDCIERTWSEALVQLDAVRSHVLPRAYGRIDNQRLRDRLLGDSQRAGAQLIEQSVRSIAPSPSATEITFDNGSRATARLFVDATGHRGRFVARPAPGDVAAQVAYGGIILAPGHGWPLGRVVLMDFSEASNERPEAPPTFVYAMPLSEDRLFVEETSLVSRPPVAFEELERRLLLRLGRLGLDRVEIEEVERCYIPMGLPLPPAGQAVFAFGGAASMVHPASGYMIASVLRNADQVAAAISEGSCSAERAWQVLWPRERRRTWELYRFGMEVLLELDLDSTRIFFDRFFELPFEQWRAYLSGVGSLHSTTAAMRALFGRLPWRLRATIVQLAIGGRGRHLLRALL